MDGIVILEAKRHIPGIPAAILDFHEERSYVAAVMHDGKRHR